MISNRKKTIALMQPYFFPYIGYFDLVVMSDHFVFYDDASYSKNSWYNRNRVLSANKEWDYINVAVEKSPLGTPCKEIKLSNKLKDYKKCIGKLQPYSKRAPFYKDVIQIVNNVFDITGESLAELSINSVVEVSSYIGLKNNFEKSSDIIYENEGLPQDKVLSICKELSATDYINLSGGVELYNQSFFQSNNVNLHFTKNIEHAYQPLGFKFIENLSMLDVLMWNSKEEVLQELNKRKGIYNV